MGKGYRPIERRTFEALAAVPDNILSSGYELYQQALSRSKRKGISVLVAFKEIAEELPEPLRSAALDGLQDAARLKQVVPDAPHGKLLA